jgi:DNA-binding transcriptional ArsR family regulator
MIRTYRNNPKRNPLEQARAVCHCLKGISHESRLSVLNLLRSGEKSVNALAEALECPQPTLSQHLAVMRDRQILIARREGNQIYYSVRDPRVFELLDLFKSIFCHA